MEYQYNTDYNSEEAPNTGYTGPSAYQENANQDGGHFPRTSSYNSAAGVGDSRKRDRREFEKSDDDYIKDSQLYKELLHKLSSAEGQRKHTDKLLIAAEAEKQALIQKHLAEKAEWAEEKVKIISEMNQKLVDAYTSVLATRK